MGADVPGASHCRALLTAGVSFSNQRAAGAKALWGVNRVSTLYLLHFWCLFQAIFKLLPLLGLLHSSLPCSTSESCCAGAGVASAPWQVLEPVQDWLAAHPRVLRGWVVGGPSQRVVLLGWQSEHRMLRSRWRGGLGWAEVLWVFSRT